MITQNMKTTHRQMLLAMPVSLLTFSNPVQADALSIKPGLWETTITSTSQSLGSRTETIQTCLEKDEYDAKKLLNEVVQTDDCEIQSSVSGEVLEYTFSCQADTGMVFGDGNVTTDGDTTSGMMNMQMESEGVSLGFKVNSHGRRVGNC